MKFRRSLLITAITLSFGAGSATALAAEPAEEPQAGEITEQAEQLLGQPLFNEEGEEIGLIAEIAQDPASGDRVVVVEHDQLLGMGVEHSMVPMEEVRAGEQVVLEGPARTAADLERYEPRLFETIAQAPEATPAEPPPGLVEREAPGVVPREPPPAEPAPEDDPAWGEEGAADES